MSPADEDASQRRYFELAEHRYPRASILEPPVHTAVEVQLVLDRLAAARIETAVVDFSAGSLEALRATARELALPAIRTATAPPADERFSAIVGADVIHHVEA